MRYEILIELNGVKQQLDTYKGDPISLTFNVADVADISSRNSSFSKTIKLPETGNNRLIFGDISDLGVDSSFNPNKKTKCWILVDTAVVFEGYLQLKKVFVDKELDKCDYEVVVYADNDNFFKQLGNKFITDSDYSELNHYWNANVIRSSWTSEWNNGYYYPLIDYGYDWDLGEINGWTTTYNTEVKTKDMFPATNVKYIWNKIFNEAGYTYQSNFLDSEIFTSLYIPFNREKLLRPNTSTASRFSIGRTQSATFSNTSTVTVAGSTIIENDPYYGPIEVSNPVVTKLGTFRIPFNSEASPNGDPDNLYNTTTYEYTAPTDFISERFVCNFDITFRFNVDFNAFTNFSFTNYATTIQFKRSRNPNTGATVSGGYAIPVGGSIAARPFKESSIPGVQFEAAGGTSQQPRRTYGQISTDILDNSTPNLKKLYPGEKVWVEVVYSALNTDIRTTIGNSNLLPPTVIVAGNSYNTTLPVGTVCGTFSGNNKFFNVLNTTVLVDEVIDYNQVLPLNIKQSDFIVSIIKMFNLYVEPSKEYDNQLIIEPRDAYYAAGKIKDWTGKLNIDEDIEEQILGDTQNKKTIWKYKDDKDWYNEDYKNNRGGLSYGEYNFYSSNEFVSGEKKVELTFSPTPLASVNGSTQLVIPKIGKLNNNLWARTEANIRILTKFNSSTNSTWVYGDYQFFSDSSQWNAYTVLTSNGFGNALHPFKVGDYVNVSQTDGGLLKPMLQGNFKIVAIRDTKSIVINIPFSVVGSGASVGGTVTPLDGLLPVATDSDSWSFEGIKYKAYPYLGHFNNPQNPSYDINFGQTNGLYYLEETVTNDNLYSVYWENFINELFDKDSRIITASFYLTPFDIADFRFNDNIYIGDQYYKVNKILNYDPTKEALVKIELIKSKYITIPRAFSNVKPSLPITGAVGSSVPDIKKPPRPTGGLISSGTNTVVGGKNIVVGKDNAVYASKSLVLGASNSVASDTKAYVLGDNNSVEGNSEKTVVIGDNNTISEGVTGSVVFGSGNVVSGSNITLINVNGVTATQSGMTYLGPSFSISQTGDMFYNGATFSAGSQDLETTLGYGNITGAHDIVITTGQKITSDTGSQSIDMNAGSFGNIIELKSMSSIGTEDIISVDPDQYGNLTGISSTNGSDSSITFYSPGNVTSTSTNGLDTSTITIIPTEVRLETPYININNAYNLPVIDGASGDVLTTNGSGVVTWSSSSGISGSGTADRITKWNSSTSITDSSIIDNGVTVDFTTNARLTDGSYSLPSISFVNAPDTGLFYSFQHPAINRLVISAGGATSAIFTPTDVRIQSLITTPGTVNRIVQVSSNGVLTAPSGSTNSIAARTYFEDAVNHYSITATASGTYSINMASANVFNITLVGNTTLDYTNAGEGSYALLIKQDATGNRSLSLAGGGKFIGTSAISIGTASNAKSLIQIMHIGTQSIITSQKNLFNL